MYFGRLSTATTTLLVMSSFAAAAAATTYVRIGSRFAADKGEEATPLARHLLDEDDVMVKDIMQDVSTMANKLLPEAAAANTDGSNPLSFLDTMTAMTEQQSGNCDSLKLYATTNDYNNPTANTLDDGTTSYMFPIYYSSDSRPAGYYHDFPAKKTNLNDGTCIHGGAYAFESADHLLITFDKCNGSSFDGYDQMIFGGRGRYDCVGGTVAITKDASRVTFDLSFCPDPKTC